MARVIQRPRCGRPVLMELQAASRLFKMTRSTEAMCAGVYNIDNYVLLKSTREAKSFEKIVPEQTATTRVQKLHFTVKTDAQGNGKKKQNKPDHPLTSNTICPTTPMLARFKQAPPLRYSFHGHRHKTSTYSINALILIVPTTTCNPCPQRQ